MLDQFPVLNETAFGSYAGYTFDGSNDLIQIPDHNDFNLASTTTNKSVAISFKTGIDIGTRQVIYEQGGGSRGLAVYIENNNLYFSAWNIPNDQGDGAWGPIRISSPVSVESVYYVTFTYDGAAGEISAHANGVSLGTQTGVGTLYAHGGDIGIGGMKDGSYFTSAASGNGHYFSGEIGELIYWNETINGDQISDLHDYMSSRY